MKSAQTDERALRPAGVYPLYGSADLPARCPKLTPLSPRRNLVRTRLQAQGTPSHPQTYTGIRDAAFKCYQLEGWRGFYKGELSGEAKASANRS